MMTEIMTYCILHASVITGGSAEEVCAIITVVSIVLFVRCVCDDLARKRRITFDNKALLQQAIATLLALKFSQRL